jgi:hypothetical protein
MKGRKGKAMVTRHVSTKRATATVAARARIRHGLPVIPKVKTHLPGAAR